MITGMHVVNNARQQVVSVVISTLSYSHLLGSSCWGWEEAQGTTTGEVMFSKISAGCS